MLEHGGRLLAAARQYDIPPEQWLDLSTAINPNGWPIPAIPDSCWRRLPEDEDGLLSAASRFYGTPHLLAASGSQAAIQQLPRLRAKSKVAVLAPTYAEHAYAWACAGHDVNEVDIAQVDGLGVDVLLLVNPNNPTGRAIPVATLLEWREKLAQRGGWLVVDEAFMDTTPEASLAPYIGLPGLIVLRSLGKFFGLAGARVGFTLAWPALLETLREAMGPWPVSGPARWVAQGALNDMAWHAEAKQRLPLAAERLRSLLAQHGLVPAGGTALFQWMASADAAKIHHQLASRGILTRLFTTPSALRFGLPGVDQEWSLLEAALQSLND